MTERESDEIVLYLHAARADWTDRTSTGLLRVWADTLCHYPSRVGWAGARSFFGSRAPKQVGFPPELSEFVHHLNQARERQSEQARSIEQLTLKEAAQLVFHGDPADERLTRDGGIGAFACALIRDLCDDKITHAEYTARRAEMDRRWP